MALNLSTRYPGQVATGDANWPTGRPRNVTVPGDGTGTPWEQDIPQDIYGWLQGLMVASGITPNGAPDHASGVGAQYIEALHAIILQDTTVTIVKDIAEALLPPLYAIQIIPALNLDDRWIVGDAGDPENIRQQSVSSIGRVMSPFVVPYKYARIKANSVSVKTKGTTSGRGGLPSSIPHFLLGRRGLTIGSGDSPDVLAQGDDGAADVSTYEADHVTTFTHSAIDISPGDLLFMEITGEAGSNSVNGYEVYGVWFQLEIQP
jgi:hypothetical protein